MRCHFGGQGSIAPWGGTRWGTMSRALPPCAMGRSGSGMRHEFPTAHVGRASVKRRQNLSNDGLYLPCTADGMRFFEPPSGLIGDQSCYLCGAQGTDVPPNLKKVVARLRVNWGHASAQQFKRVPADSDQGNLHLSNCVDAALARCDVCGALNKAPHTPITGTLSISTIGGKL